MKICCISDTHEQHHMIEDMPPADVLVHAGDFTGRGFGGAIESFAHWLRDQPYKHKIVIAGNHDLTFESTGWAQRLLEDVCPRVHYLNESGVEIDGVKFWGSPWTPAFHNWAFNAERGADIRRHWNKIPDDTNVLITHGPPWGILDVVRHEFNPSSDGPLGCADLKERVLQLKQLKLHVFGHIHDGYGTVPASSLCQTTFVNASICNEKYRPNNRPVVVELPCIASSPLSSSQ